MFRIQKRIIVEKFPGRNFSDIIYNLKLSWSYFKKFFYHIWWFRGRDYNSTLELLLLSLKEQLSTIKSATHKEYMEPVNNLERCIELLDNMIKNDYDDRCGYDYNYKISFVPYKGKVDLEDETDENLKGEELFEMVSDITDEQKTHNDNVREQAKALKEKEEEEFFRLFRENYQSWWS